MIGTVKGYRIDKNQDGDKNVILLQVEMHDESDIQTVQLYAQAGNVSIPQTGSKVVVFEDDKESWKKGIGIDDTIEPSGVTDGDKKLYSSDAGVIKAFILLLKTGIIELNGNNDFAVRFNALNTALQTMLTALNADIVVAGGAGSSTLDISAAKVDEIKVI